MIRYLKHNEIDKEKWDDCIAESVNTLIYGYSWYLDLVCDDWDGLVAGDYKAVFPLPWRKKYRISYLYQPPFTQQLGLFSREKPDLTTVDDFLNAIPPKFRFAEIFLNRLSFPLKIKIKSRNNYEFSLASPYPIIRSGYSKNLNTNLKRAAKNELFVAAHPDINKIIELFRMNRGSAIKSFDDAAAQHLRRLCHSLEHRGHARSWGAYSKTNDLLAGIIFFFDKQRAIFIFSGLSNEGRSKGAMPLIVDHVIQQYAGSDTILDFEGSMDPGLARFFASFGAELHHYWFYRHNRLPFPLKQIVRLIKG